MLYFPGYFSFSPDLPFDASLFAEFRTRIGLGQINAIDEKIHALSRDIEAGKANSVPVPEETSRNTTGEGNIQQKSRLSEPMQKPTGKAPILKGRALFDATACPRDIAFPTDLGLLSEARKKSEQIIDETYSQALHLKKPRTCREKASKEFLNVAQKENKKRSANNSVIWPGTLRALKRYWTSINYFCPIPGSRSTWWSYIPSTNNKRRCLMTVSITVEDRIVSIQQPHVRPIVG